MALKVLTLCLFGKFADFLPCADLFFKIDFFEKFFQEHHQSVKQLDPDLDRHYVGSDLGPNCLQQLSADVTSSQRVFL